MSHVYKYPDSISSEELQEAIVKLRTLLQTTDLSPEDIHQARSELQYLLYKQALRGGQ